MATNIASLAVSLVAHTAVFRRKMSRATGTVTKFGRMAVSAGKMAFRLATAITAIGVAAGAAALGGLALLTKASFKNLDVLAKTAQKLGFTTQNLGRLQLAASESGVEIRQLEKGLQNMIAKVQEAADGTGEAVDALKKLGISAEELGKKTPLNQFFAIGDALKLVRTQAEKVAIAYDIFGGRGTDLLRILDLNKAQLAEVSHAADVLGLSFNDMSLQMVENANDAAARVKLAFKGLGNAIAVQIAPFVQAGSEAIFKFIEDIGGIPAAVDKAFTFGEDKIANFLDMIGGIDNAFNTVKATVESLAISIGSLIGEAASAATTLIDLFDPNFARGKSFFGAFIESRRKQKRAAERNATKVPPPVRALRDSQIETPGQIKTPGQKFKDFVAGIRERAAEIAEAIVAQQAAAGPGVEISTDGIKKLVEAAVGTGLEKVVEREEEKRPALSRIFDEGMELRGGVGQGKLGRTFFGNRGDRHQQRQIQLLEQIANNTRTPVAVAG